SHLLPARRPDRRIGQLPGTDGAGRPLRPARQAPDGVSDGLAPMSDQRDDRRRDVLRANGASDRVAIEILASDTLPYTRDDRVLQLPLEDEPMAEAWRRYAVESRGSDTAVTLARHLIQLRFPVQAGISETDAYR